jgi:SpoVK/Ycf46/Vps4 family AAA+-type ATPase
MRTKIGSTSDDLIQIAPVPPETEAARANAILMSLIRKRIKQEEIQLWFQHNEELRTTGDLNKIINPGYRTLFYGPPGTGKTLTADSVFGKRTQVSSSNDRYANQETAYLLQRIEDCPNPVIMASNLRANIDSAFMRRFQSVVQFPVPRVEERLRLWRQSFSFGIPLDESIKLEEIITKIDLTGGAITNVVRFASLMAIQKSNAVVIESDLIDAINRELIKEGKKQ